MPKDFATPASSSVNAHCVAASPALVVRQRKLSERVAEGLMQEIRRRGWPVGESLGNEAELMSKFGVSRATLIEAIRQVERHGAAAMRRGGGGGLVVTNSAAATISRTISTYLELSNVTIDEQYEAATLIETISAQLASERASELTALDLRRRSSDLSAIDSNLELHRSAMQLRIAVADAAKCAPLSLFMRALARVLTRYVRPDLRLTSRNISFELSVRADLEGLTEAIVGGDTALAEHYVQLDAHRRHQRAREFAISQPSLATGALRRDTPFKLAEVVAFAIRDSIAAIGWPAHQRLGDENELAKHYGASKWVVRQALRILEPHAIVHVRRGHRGGVFTAIPSPEYTVVAAVAHLAEVSAEPDEVSGLLTGLLQNVASLAARRATEAERDQLMLTFSSNETSDLEIAWELLLKTSRSAVLGLFSAILRRYLAGRASDIWRAGNRALLVRMAKAIYDGDGALARRRMAEYLSVGP